MPAACAALAFAAISCTQSDNDDDAAAIAFWSQTSEKNAAAANQKAANAVIAKIDAIGTVAYTSESKAKIDEARTAYDELTETQKALVTNYDTLTAAESTYSTLKAAADGATANQAAANAVIAKITAIGTVAYTAECKAKIDEARTAYDELTTAQKALISAETLAVLTNAESTYATHEAAANHTAADAVIAKISAIGNVAYSDASKALIDDARAAYDALTAAQRALVTNYATLTTAETTYESLKTAAEAAANQAAAEAVIEKISAIGEVACTTESKAKIDDARAAYNALSTAQKDLIPAETLAVLTKAETDYTAADAVIEKISAIGDVAYTDESKALIDAARDAYNALTATQQALVTNYNVLTAAEESYRSLTPVGQSFGVSAWQERRGDNLGTE